MSSAPVLCRVSFQGLRFPPHCGQYEAHQLSGGFEVSFRNERLCPEGKIIATCHTAYSARAFALSILNFRRSMMPCRDNTWEDVPPTVTIVGARGIRAQLLLRLASEDWPPSYLEQQSEAALDLLDPLVGHPPSRNALRDAIEGTMYLASLLGHDLDTIALLRRYDLPLSLDSLPALEAAVESDLAARQAERPARIAPFRREIDAIKMKFSNYNFRFCGGATDRWVVEGFLEDYVVEHGRMPQGKMSVEYRTWPYRNWGRSIGTVDFDELATLDRWPHGRWPWVD